MVAVSCLVHYDMLLQSTTDINNAGTILLQNATKVYFKMRYVTWNMSLSDDMSMVLFGELHHN